MTATRRTSTTTETKHGELIQTPPHCPDWCTTDHVMYAMENERLLDAADIRTHHFYGGEQFLPEIRNNVSNAVERDGGGRYYIEVRQAERENRGYESWPLLGLTVEDRGLGVNHGGFINLTTGEARVLAAQLIATADRVDLPSRG